MMKVSINGLRAFLHIHELKTKSRFTGHTGLREVALETLPKIPSRGATDGERENRLREYTGDVANNELVLLVPLSMGGIGSGKSDGGGCGCYGGRSGGLRLFREILRLQFSALIHSRGHRASLVELINEKEVVGDLFNQLRLASQRRTKGRLAQTLAATNLDDQELSESMQKLLIVMQRLDQKIAPMLEADGELFNKRWGFLSRAGLWDKSYLMRQIEKYADIYTSRVSNCLHYTPFMYFRSQEQTLAHDSYSY
ncbi:hypothetical protein L3X38_001934 [Prunus dulcis]|uniref:Uncharacterized protein n=1 Tax=Prunus dulcis TaxID=3755 RepID=A0AAD4WV06_PRUDU|nr:hypothetical protein L3X38_001934 [Prunus dulcis]